MSRLLIAALVWPALLLAVPGLAAAPAANLPLQPPATATQPCLSDGSGYLRASLRGALSLDLQWHNAQLHCEGGLRPDGSGLRLTLVGPLPAATGQPLQQLRFVFGIDTPHGTAAEGKALATNLTLIIEGAAQLYATRGDDKCTTDRLQRTPLAAKLSRIEVHGFCTGPATSADGNQRVLLTTFDLTTRLTEE